MAQLIKSIAEVKEHAAVNINVEFDTVKPYIKQAERKYIKYLIGETLYAAYVAAVPTEPKPLEVYKLLAEASVNLAWYLYLPLANVQVSDAGITVNAVEGSKAAEWWQVRDLRRSFIDAGNGALDEALKIMEANEPAFPDWSDADGYTVFKELFVKRTDTFDRWFSIGKSRQAFLALRPYMLESHHQYFTAKFSAETLVAINQLTDIDPETYQVLEFLQAAMVHYTVYKAVNSGTFQITANGIYQTLSDFPGYKTKSLEEPQIHRIKEERLIAAEEYYKKAIKIIEANPVVFPDYEQKDTAQFIKPMNTGSTVSF